MISMLRTVTMALFLGLATSASGQESQRLQVQITEAQRQQLEQYRKLKEQSKAQMPEDGRQKVEQLDRMIAAMLRGNPPSAGENGEIKRPQELQLQNIDLPSGMPSLSRGEISFLYYLKLRGILAGVRAFGLSTMQPDFNVFSSTRIRHIIGQEESSVPTNLVPVALQTDLLELEGIEKELLGHVGGSVAQWLTIATALARVGAYDDAERVYRHVLSSLNASSAETEAIHFELFGRYCAFLLSTGRIDEALELAQEAGVTVQSRAKVSAIQNPAASELSTNYYAQLAVKFSSLQGAALAAMGRWADAEALHLSNAELLPSRSKSKLVEQGRAVTAMLHQQGKGIEAEELIREQLSLLPSIDQFAQAPELEGYQHLQRALLRAVLAHAELIQNKPKQAEATARIAMAEIEKLSSSRAAGYSSGATSAVSPYIEYLLAKSIRLQGRRDEALVYATQAFTDFEASDLAKAKPRSVDSAKILEEILLTKVPLANRTGVSLTDSLFQSLQKWHESTSGKTIEQLFKRLTSDEGALATLIRERQDLVRRRTATTVDVARSILVPRESAGASDIVGIDKNLERVNQRIASEFPRFSVLTTNVAANLNDTQNALGPDDALLAWFIGDEGAWIVIVRSGDARILPLSVQAAEVQKKIQSLRKAIELGESGLGVFPAKKANDLYRDLFAPAETYLKGVRHLYSVVGPTVSNLPLSVLLTSEPAKQYINPGDLETLKNAPWLIKQYSITMLPSVSSLHMLRTISSPRTVRAPFLGIGDPVLGGNLSETVGLRSVPQVRFRGSLADVKQVSLLVPLPETADELKMMGRALSPDGGVLMLGKQATERAVKAAPLDHYRVLGFATHGLIAGEFSGIREPGLVLSPPAEPTDEDDGVLTSSEVAQLKLNADWVLLSACNTGAGDGGTTNDVLGGLANSFFYAGARSLLVSHWKVASTATVALTTETVRLSEQPGVSKAEAHRQAMLSMINSGDAIKAHPSVWAAFFLVGDDGLHNSDSERR